MELVVIGGGCYGTYHARQLLKAVRAGKLDAEHVMVVDRNADCRARRELGHDPLFSHAVSDWHEFLAGYLGATHADGYVVPAPFTPHLFYRWLARSLESALGSGTVGVEPVAGAMGLPVEHQLPDGQRAISYAPWLCPVNCVEPEICPHTKGPKDWSLERAVERFSTEPAAGLSSSVVFPSYHLAYGIAAVPVRKLLQARESVLAAACKSPQRVAVATVSHCHGIVGVLSVAQVSLAEQRGLQQHRARA